MCDSDAVKTERACTPGEEEQRCGPTEKLAAPHGKRERACGCERCEARDDKAAVNALDAALRSALTERYPAIAGLHLIDFKVRILDASANTDAVTRVLIDSTDGDETWTTIGVSANLIEASWVALTDALVFGLLRSAEAG